MNPTPTPLAVENLSSMKPVPGAKKLGTAAVEAYPILLPVMVNPFKEIALPWAM